MSFFPLSFSAKFAYFFIHNFIAKHLSLLAGRTARQRGAEQTGAGARARQPDHAGGQSEAGQVHHGDRSQDVRLHLSFGQEEHGAANVSHEECSGGPETRRH